MSCGERLLYELHHLCKARLERGVALGQLLLECGNPRVFLSHLALDLGHDEFVLMHHKLDQLLLSFTALNQKTLVLVDELNLGV